MVEFFYLFNPALIGKLITVLMIFKNNRLVNCVCPSVLGICFFIFLTHCNSKPDLRISPNGRFSIRYIDESHAILRRQDVFALVKASYEGRDLSDWSTGDKVEINIVSDVVNLFFDESIPGFFVEYLKYDGSSGFHAVDQMGGKNYEQFGEVSQLYEKNHLKYSDMIPIDDFLSDGTTFSDRYVQ